MLKLPGRCFLIMLVATVLDAAAQQAARINQKALLEQTRSAYYQPLDRGVSGFACTVSFDWNEVLERASGRKIPPKEPTLVALKSATTTVTDDLLKGPSLKVDYPGAAPPAGSAAASRQKILNNLVTASLAGWNPFLNDRIFPMEGTKYRFEAVPTGYRLTLEGTNFFSILELDARLQVSHGESHLNGTTTEFTPTFDPSSHGWLITSLKTQTAQSVTGAAEAKAESSSSPDSDKASFTFSYQFVGGMLVPKRVEVQYGDGIETPYELKDCSLLKTGSTTAESKAATSKSQQ